ncbi:MAG: YgiQ family radical SAM protein [Lachnospiraceae bacterium]|nr:YgiQ family radical SAM protein [Lachnospiraceae bacterium]
MVASFLPISKEDLKMRNWDYVDFVYVIGDAYVDHPSFGHAIISRVLDAHGYRVAIISQPDWKDKESITVFGEPRLGFLISAGNMDSMVNHYTVSKKRREKDAYTPGGIMGKRPDYATVVYGNLIRQTYKKTPIIIGGVEASLRRLAHYDYWSNSLKRSILLDSAADILIYGMGEKAIVEIADALNAGIDVKDITYVKGTAYKTSSPVEDFSESDDSIVLYPYSDLLADKKNYAKSFYIQYQNTDPFNAKRLIEPYPNGINIVVNTPAMPLTTQEFDDIYEYDYTKTYHPSYESLGGVAALSEVKFSITSNRGCIGACNFCSLNFHQGRIIQARSHESIIKEAKAMVKDPDFKGYIHDVGGPTANFRKPACKKQLEKGACKDKQCLFPTACKNLEADHKDYLKLLRELKAIDGVKKVFIRSGIRFDYLIYDKDESFFKELIKDHISGQLRVAPEHVSSNVLEKMGKPDHLVYERFVKRFDELNKKSGKKQFIVPYLMSSHPGSTLKDAVILAEYLRDINHQPEQVQDFYPTPSTLSTCMYYTGLDPRNLKPVYIAKNPHEKAMQRALLQYKNPANKELVIEALKAAGRMDLIGVESKCLIKTYHKNKSSKANAKSGFLKASGSKKNAGTDKKVSKKKTIRNVHKKK